MTDECSQAHMRGCRFCLERAGRIRPLQSYASALFDLDTDLAQLEARCRALLSVWCHECKCVSANVAPVPLGDCIQTNTAKCAAHVTSLARRV